MDLIDARRLTGPNVLMDLPGSILDIRCNEQQRIAVGAIWEAQLRRMLADLGWTSSTAYARLLTGGLSLAFSAPIDRLYAATAINEWAGAVCAAEMLGNEPPDYDEALAGVQAAAADEANPELLLLQEAAAQHGVTLLWDDDEVSLGMGSSAVTWPFRELPSPGDVDWAAFADIPVGLITGTNGKTTTARLVRHIALRAGRVPGLCSTDWIAAGEDIVEHGDWSGPGGARTVLRHPDVELAILESARGGLLRRGLGVQRADAALITNIAEDHLGDFGSQTVEELLDIKWVVSRAAREQGTLVLNADDARLVDKAKTHDGRIVWFSLDAGNPVVAAHCDNGGTAFVLDGSLLLRRSGHDDCKLCRVDEIPITLQGAARHNIANALAAAALCDQLGIDSDAVADGLKRMTQQDNPGRCNVYDIAGRQVLVDFAHNPHAMQALFDMARTLPAKRRILAFSQAGDRTDAQIRELATSAWAIGLDRVLVSELAAYRRGRDEREVFTLIRDALLASGARAEQVEHYWEETAALDAALDLAAPGDLVIMLALADSKGVRAKLDALAAG